MKHDLPKHIEGKSGAEITAFTLKAVKSIVQGEAMTEQTPLPASQVQQPPHMRGKLDVVETKPQPKPETAVAPEPEVIAPAAPVAQAATPVAQPAACDDAPAETIAEPDALHCAAHAPRKRSFLARLTGR
ncbi:MAG: hypothetical protein AAFY52_08840 [Pseudomonadota bacterium]